MTVDLYTFTVTDPGYYVVNGTVTLANATSPSGNYSVASCLAYSTLGPSVLLGQRSTVSILSGSKITIPVSDAQYSLSTGDVYVLRCELDSGPAEIVTSTFNVTQVGAVTLIPVPD